MKGQMSERVCYVQQLEMTHLIDRQGEAAVTADECMDINKWTRCITDRILRLSTRFERSCLQPALLSN